MKRMQVQRVQVRPQCLGKISVSWPGGGGVVWHGVGAASQSPAGPQPRA